MFNLVLADKLLDLACNLVDRDYKTPALHHIFSTLYDKQTEFHVLGPIDRLKSKQKSSCFDGPTNLIDQCCSPTNPDKTHPKMQTMALFFFLVRN